MSNNQKKKRDVNNLTPAFSSQEEMKAWVRQNRKRSKWSVGRPTNHKVTGKNHWARCRGYQTTFIFDAHQYVKISKLAFDEQLSIQEFMYQLLNEGLKRYESGEMNITCE